MEPLVEEGLLGVHLLEIAIGVAMHLHAIWGRWDSLVWAIHLVLRLGEDGRASLAVLGHAIVEEALVGLLLHAAGGHMLDMLVANGSITRILGNLWGIVALEVVDVEGLGQIGHVLGICGGPVQIDVVEGGALKVDQTPKVVVGGGIHVGELLSARPGLGILGVHVALRSSRTLQREAGGEGTEEGRVSARDKFLPQVHAGRWWGLVAQKREQRRRRLAQAQAVEGRIPGGRELIRYPEVMRSLSLVVVASTGRGIVSAERERGEETGMTVEQPVASKAGRRRCGRGLNGISWLVALLAGHRGPVAALPPTRFDKSGAQEGSEMQEGCDLLWTNAQ